MYNLLLREWRYCCMAMVIPSSDAAANADVCQVASYRRLGCDACHKVECTRLAMRVRMLTAANVRTTRRV